jgi:hypothetical protein
MMPRALPNFFVKHLSLIVEMKIFFRMDTLFDTDVAVHMPKFVIYLKTSLNAKIILSASRFLDRWLASFCGNALVS